MANKTTANPWILDTAGLVTTRPIRVSKLRWNPAAANNDLIVTDADGNEIWNVRAITSSSNMESVGAEEMNFSPPFVFSGLTIHTIDAGKVYVYFEQAS